MVHLPFKVEGIKIWSKLYIVPELDQTMILLKEKPSPDKFESQSIKGGKNSTWY